ncbi:hypothetical protein OBP_068 [Pseudomonas phage OBP]|uniref:hypothetical protein n=1 Tax=Pseudomonas phage OBP TaxID=1124849 RepID=UPI000240D422|nr:hypothetical protein OBP_068 [Pseudomonas phage OBP]AEV89505.1 hypothetical protein OBP_068 [Pseudomonas phage OBP]
MIITVTTITVVAVITAGVVTITLVVMVVVTAVGVVITPIAVVVNRPSNAKHQQISMTTLISKD